jgi:hypothetical protein
VKALVATAAALLLAAAAPAGAANSRSFVASDGNDANTCQLTAPCRSFAVAIAATASGGEVVALDSAGYGPFAITKPISIIASPGVHAGIAVTSGIGIDVAAGSGDVVLRGLSVTGVAGSSVGINVSSVGTMTIERCAVSGMGSHGLQFQPPTALVVADSVFRRNGGHGIAQLSGRATYVRVRSEHNSAAGLSAAGEVTETDDSVFSHNAGGGVIGAQAVLLASSQVLDNGQDGVFVTPYGPLSIVDSVIAGNASRGVLVAGGETTLTRTAILRNGYEGVNASGGGTSVVLDGVTLANNGTGAVTVAGGVSAVSRGNNSIAGTVNGAIASQPLQ